MKDEIANMSAKGRIAKLGQIKDMVHNFSKDVERVEKYADVRLGVANLTKSMRDIQRLQDSLHQVAPTAGESSEASLTAFSKWFVDNGGVLNHCHLARTAEGCGIVADSQIEAGQTVITVPNKLVLGVSRALAIPKLGDSIRKDERISNSPVIVLALSLLFERSLGAKSSWKPYLDVLPSKFSIPLFWSIDDLNLIAGSPAFDEYSRFLNLVCRQYCYLYEKFSTSPNAPLAVSALSLRNFLWAVGVVVTRRNVVPVGANNALEECLIPMWDMCNHRQGRITTLYDPETSQVVCETQEATAPNEQVSIFYGARGVSHMLLFSGFVPPRSESHDYLPLWLRLPPPSQQTPHDSPVRRDHELRKRLLESANVPTGSHRVSRDAVGAPSLRFVRALVLSGDALYGATLETISAPLALPQLEQSALSTLRNALLELIAAYTLDIASDATADNDDTAAVVLSNADMARRLVARERGILRDATKMLDDMIAKSAAAPAVAAASSSTTATQ